MSETEPVTLGEIERLRALLDKATDGGRREGWHVSDGTYLTIRQQTPIAEICRVGGLYRLDWQRDAAELIVALRNNADRILNAATEYARLNVVTAREALWAAYKEGWVDAGGWNDDVGPAEGYAHSGAKQVADEIAGRTPATGES